MNDSFYDSGATVFTRSSWLLGITLILFAVALITGCLIIREMERGKNVYQLANYAGVLRGSVQRMVKVALAGGPIEDVCDETESLLAKVKKEVTKGRLLLASHSSAQLRADILHVERVWTEIRDRSLRYPGLPSLEEKIALLSSSEESWEFANKMFLLAQEENERRAGYLRILIGIIILNLAAIVLVIFYFRHYVKGTLEFLASHDALTKAMNRFSFNAIFSMELERAIRYGSPLTLILIDLDFFKAVNDSCGHRKGDLILKAMAKSFHSTIRTSDRLFRVGGEEFAILAVHTELSEGILLSERIRKTIEEKDFRSMGRLTVSLGVSQYKPGDSEERFFCKADQALYVAKSKGRNRTEVYVESEYAGRAKS